MKNKKPARYYSKLKILLLITLFAVESGLLQLILTRAAGVYSPPSSIASDCSVDVTPALNSWLASVPNSSTIVFKVNACYRIDETLNLNNRSGLVLDGQGATFKAVTTGDRTRSQWSTNGGSNLTFKNMIIRGANPHAGTSESAYVASLEAQHAFNIIATRGVTIQNNQAYDLYGDFVYFGGNSTGFSGNATVSDNFFDRNGRQGISITGGDHISVINNDIRNVRRTVFDLEPNTSSGGAFNIFIDHNTIGAHRLNFLSSLGADGNIHDITISNNYLKGSAMNMLVHPPHSRRKNFFFINNTSDSAFGSGAGAAASFYSVDNLQFKNNTQPLQAGRNMAWAKLTDTTGVVLTGNTFKDGTKLYFGTNNIITSNCGNRLTATGAFNIPTICTVISPPNNPPSSVPSTSPSNSLAPSANNGAITPVSNGHYKTAPSSPDEAAKALVTKPVAAVETVSSYITDSHLPIWARILAGIALLLIAIVVLAIIYLLYWLLITHVLKRHQFSFK